MRALFLVLASSALVLITTTQAVPQSNEDGKALKAEIEALKATQDIIQRQLEEIKSLLRIRLTSPTFEPRELVVSVKDSVFKGAPTAKVTLIEFSDYQCPFCARFSHETLPQLDRDYISNGKLKYALRSFPIEEMHPQALKAAEAAYCAGDQAKYWQMHDRLFANQRALDIKDLIGHAQDLGIDPVAFQKCLDTGKYTARIRKDVADGRAAGVWGTTTFYLALTEASNGDVKTVRVIHGAQPYAAFREAIDNLLAGDRQ